MHGSIDTIIYMDGRKGCFRSEPALVRLKLMGMVEHLKLIIIKGAIVSIQFSADNTRIAD
jgi:hypothetical protein